MTIFSSRFLPRTTELVPVLDDNGLPLMREGVAVLQTQVTFSPLLLVFATVVMLALHAIIFRNRGGEIQKIVLSKTNSTDIRAATAIDLIYGIILYIFKEVNDVPMSTTWVFLGMLAGREIAIAYIAGLRSKLSALWDVTSDVLRAFLGLIISVVLAIFLPAWARGELGELMADLPGYVARALGF